MKKYLILPIACSIFLSCGPSAEDKKNVCGCEALFQTMKDREGDYQIEEKISSSEAQQKVEKEFQAEYHKCTELHKHLGDDSYLKVSKECGSK